MATHAPASLSASPSADLSGFGTVRQQTMRLVEGLSDADATLQSMEDASPAKWHLAHTTWFFETFLLAKTGRYTPFHPDYNYLFNSYYDAIGARHPRPKRGLLTRPSLSEIVAYREHVDAAMADAIEAGDVDTSLLALGLHHEQQHQELLLTDLLHGFAQNPLGPAYRSPSPLAVGERPAKPGWTRHDGGIVQIGATGEAFAFDCETARHDALLRPFELQNRAVTNGEWKAFIADGGYDDPLLWLSDGWATRQAEGWQAPLYWHESEDGWSTMTLRGRQSVDDDAPVCHISFFEADAYASWAGARLPTEFEWEALAANRDVSGNDASTERYRPAAQFGADKDLVGLFGDVWEWTASAFRPYPGFQVSEGAAGEYNGKFMSGQMVLRGSSCVSAKGHSRASYRNFFHPDKRWQFSGLRLARDA